MTPRGAFKLHCVYIAQLITHTPIYTPPFCYKPLGILQKITKCQKFIIKSLPVLWFCNTVVQVKSPFNS